MKASFSWSARRDGNLGFVLETHPDGSSHEFVMPSHLVPSFVRARRTLIDFKMKSVGATASLEPEHDFTFLEESSSNH